MFSYAFALAVMAYASYLDVKHREVPDRVWLFAMPVGALLTALNVLGAAVTMMELGVSMAFSLALGLALSCFGLFGGADAKALVFLGLAVPAYSGFKPVFGDPIGLPVLTMLLNSCLFALACPVVVFTLNVVDILKGERPLDGLEADRLHRAILLFTTRKVKLERLGLFRFPAETPVEVNGKVVRKPLLLVHAEADINDMIEKLKSHQGIYSDGVLASPTLPLLVFFTAGLAGLAVGNIPLLMLAAFGVFH